MLKWTVNGSRRSYLPSVGECDITHDKIDSTVNRGSLNCLTHEGSIYGNVERRRVRRNASNLNSQRYNFRSVDKENQLTSTPLTVSIDGFNNSPSRKLDSLKDLSNITPDDCSESPFKSTPLITTVLQTPVVNMKQPLRSIPAQYASTLPTFDVEYSPCGLVPGPILALRGISIADTYFEKPRYLTQKDEERLVRKHANLYPKTFNNDVIKPSANDEESSISSSKMGDMTLERMIDAILESARKERKLPKSTKQTACPPVMSPTYTAADDPASDLHEFWDAASEQYYQKAQRESRLKNSVFFNEREVRSPLSFQHGQQQEVDAFHLRRQRAFRRKRKMTVTKVTASVKSSAQKMFFIGGVIGARKITHKNLDPAIHELIMPCENHPNNHSHNISPDSGRNSSSDYEDSTLDGCNVATGIVTNRSEDIIDTTKRRLSFSLNNMNNC